MKFEVTVRFYLELEASEIWSPESCALDFVRHRIDEGYLHDEIIFGWDFSNVEQVEAFRDGVEEQWEEHEEFLRE